MGRRGVKIGPEGTKYTMAHSALQTQQYIRQRGVIIILVEEGHYTRFVKVVLTISCPRGQDRIETEGNIIPLSVKVDKNEEIESACVIRNTNARSLQG